MTHRHVAAAAMLNALPPTQKIDTLRGSVEARAACKTADRATFIAERGCDHRCNVTRAAHSCKSCRDCSDCRVYAAQVRAAKKTCSSCIARRDCAVVALAHPEKFGVWGEMSQEDRRDWWRRCRAAVTASTRNAS